MAAVGAAVLTLIVVALVVRHGQAGTERTTAASALPADSTPVPKAPAPVRSAVAKGSPAAKGSTPAKASTPVKASTPAKSSPAANGSAAATDQVVPTSAPDSAPAAAGAPAPVPNSTAVPPAAAGSQRYAQTWVNVRGNRTRSAPTVGMLNPGDAVTVDSLVRGWYRVSVDGRTLGYVHRSTLDVSRPE